MSFPKRKRAQDPELLRTVARLPCLACPPPTREELLALVENLDTAPRRCDAHHVTTRGAGGGDTADNVMPLCHQHHMDWHSKGAAWLISRAPAVRDWLDRAGRQDVLEAVAGCPDKR